MTSRGWMDPVPDPLLLRKSGSAGDRTPDLCICSQELWPLDHRGGREAVTAGKTLTANPEGTKRLERRSLLVFHRSSHHTAVCLTARPKPLPKPVLHRVRSIASSFNLQQPQVPTLWLLPHPTNCIWPQIFWFIIVGTLLVKSVSPNVDFFPRSFERSNL